MASQQKIIQVFEHQRLLKHNTYDGIQFEERYFNALLKLNEWHEGKYFTPIYEGIKFDSYVGIVQVDDLVIEILPKIEGHTAEKNQWRNALIEMLKITNRLKVNQVGQAYVDQQSIHLLDIYFDWFLNELEQLIHAGLIKQYRKETKNTLALKGKLEFTGHIRKNLVNQQRFYTTHQVYDKDHLLHCILDQALQVVEQLSKGTYRYGRCKSVQLNFPEVKTLIVTIETFQRISLDRKSEPYRLAIDLAKLILLQYAPNVKAGSENMLALLFDMNDLWEKYILAMLQQQAGGEWAVKGQDTKVFWESKSIQPDIVLQHLPTQTKIIIDTKWKNYTYDKIGMDDLRQIYVYNDFWNASIGMLLYPSRTINQVAVKGSYAKNDYRGKIGLATVLNGEGRLNQQLGHDIFEMLKQHFPNI